MNLEKNANLEKNVNVEKKMILNQSKMRLFEAILKQFFIEFNELFFFGTFKNHKSL